MLVAERKFPLGSGGPAREDKIYHEICTKRALMSIDYTLKLMQILMLFCDSLWMHFLQVLSAGWKSWWMESATSSNFGKWEDFTSVVVTTRKTQHRVWTDFNPGQSGAKATPPSTPNRSVSPGPSRRQVWKLSGARIICLSTLASGFLFTFLRGGGGNKKSPF